MGPGLLTLLPARLAREDRIVSGSRPRVGAQRASSGLSGRFRLAGGVSRVRGVLRLGGPGSGRTGPSAQTRASRRSRGCVRGWPPTRGLGHALRDPDWGGALWPLLRAWEWGWLDVQKQGHWHLPRDCGHVPDGSLHLRGGRPAPRWSRCPSPTLPGSPAAGAQAGAVSVAGTLTAGRRSWVSAAGTRPPAQPGWVTEGPSPVGAGRVPSALEPGTPRGQSWVTAPGSGPEAVCGRAVSVRLAGTPFWAGDQLTAPPVLLLQGPRPSC